MLPPFLLYLSLALAIEGESSALTPIDASAILQVEASRLPPAALDAWVADPDAPTRARAARALGRLRHADAIPALVRLAEDADPGVRFEAAFALGQTPGAGHDALVLLSGSTEPRIRAALCEALGKKGEADAIPALLGALDEKSATPGPPIVVEAAATALGRMAMRQVPGASSPEVVAALLGQLRRFGREARRGAAFSVGRIGASALPEETVARLFESAERDRDPVVRAFLLRAVGPVDAPAERKAALLERTALDTDRGVRVATARAAGSVGWRGAEAMLRDPEVAVRLEAITAVGKLSELDRKPILEPILARGDSQEAAEAAAAVGDTRLVEAAAALAALCGAGLVDPTPWLDPPMPTRLRTAAAGAATDPAVLSRLALQDSEQPVRTAAAGRLVELEPSAEEATALLGASDPVVAASAAEWLTEHPAPATEAALAAALASPDADLVRLALGALSKLYDGSPPLVRRPSPDVASRVQPLLGHPEPLVRAAANALGPKLALQRVPVHHAVHPLPPDEVALVTGARIRTSRGEVLVALFPADAPLTVWNFARLADEKYFDGLPVHRVVPDFVVQDGDPRGDGSGGPGWTIPDEVNPVPYREGTLGMALSGPDTGGSQWFVTLSPQPHLDGTYTVFGRVTSGMQAFQSMVPGDRIEQVVIERRAPDPPAGPPSADATSPSP